MPRRRNRAVTFRENDSRVRHHTAARNLALLRKVARNFVGRDRLVRASVHCLIMRCP
jgi:hypothetical protein